MCLFFQCVFTLLLSFHFVHFALERESERRRSGSERELKCCLFYCHFPLYPAAAIYSSFYTEINGQWTDFIRNNRVSYIVQWLYLFFSHSSFPLLQSQCVRSCERTHTHTLASNCVPRLRCLRASQLVRFSVKS